MKAGPLRHKVTIQRPVGARTASGAQTQEYEDWLVDIAAEVEQIGGSEKWASAQIAADIDARIRIRYRPGITAKMRVKHQIEPGSPTEVDFYDIAAPVRADGRTVELHLMCKKRDAEGFRTGRPS